MQKTPEKDLAQEVALFRYGLIADLLRTPARSAAMGALVREKASRRYRIPGSRRERVSEGTLRRWMRRYREGGLEALKPRRRRDRGQSRTISPQLSERLVRLKESHPRLGTERLIREACRVGLLPPGEKPPAESTVHRLLAAAGLTKPQEAPFEAGRRFEYRFAGQMWSADSMHGPKIHCSESDRRRLCKVYLLAIIDDATRVVPHARFAFSEASAAFLPVLRRGLERRGLPQRFYCDNGSTFRSRQLQVICATLDIHLIHSTPYRPQGRGKIERFFRTVRGQLLPLLQDADLESLQALNRRLARWIEDEYHHEPHSSLGETPLQRWAARCGQLRFPEPGLDLGRIFLQRFRRRVSKDCVVSLHGRHYEVELALAGKTVTLLRDPEAPAERPLEVESDGEPAGRAVLLDAYANARSGRRRKPAAAGRERGATPASAAPAAPAPPAAPRLEMSALQRPAAAPDDRDNRDKED